MNPKDRISPLPWRLEAIDADPESGGVDFAVLDANGDTVVEGVSDSDGRLIVAAVNAAAGGAAAMRREPTPKRFRVKKDAGSSFARVIDTEEGREVKRFNVVRRPDDWEAASRMCDRLNRQQEATAGTQATRERA